MKTRILTLILAAAALVSCGKDATETTDTTRTPLQVTATVENATRALDAQWVALDKIGISGTSGGLTYANVPYQCNNAAAGTFVPFGSQKIYFGAETGDFTAYYPYQEDDAMTSGKIAADVRKQREASKFDFLYAPKTQAHKSDAQVDLTFSHRMSKLVLHMLPGTGFSTSIMFDQRYRLELSKVHATGTFDPATGTTAVTGDPEILTFRHQDNIYGAAELLYGYHNVRYTIILFPETVAGGLELAVTELDKTTGDPLVSYTATLQSGTDGNLTLEPGKVYDFKVTVNKTGIVLSGVTITDWVPGDVPNGGEVDATM